ncbi:MAPEG family protein [Bradyrhizobium sp. GCM10023182]|uniref:MAPEG family protein n=1 Tax=Bradyrhizobium zhengyangense TaxID=2911009 RepID=A0ABS9LQK7_9BRAD|nr:MAPEG family protein [Bradyrhizobium zhengyangense]
MTIELYWLTLTALMTALFWVPYVLNRILAVGLGGALAGGAPDSGKLADWAQRAMRAHGNAIENLAIFAPIVLIAHVLGISSAATRAAVVVYFFARLAHYVVYAAGIPAARTLTFTAGWLAQIAIIASILRWI